MICRFSGCDEAAAATVGTVALCALHKSFILEMMDRGVDLTRENASADMQEAWTLISAGELEI